jgi:hypothetical protein
MNSRTWSTIELLVEDVPGAEVQRVDGVDVQLLSQRRHDMKEAIRRADEPGAVD